MKNKTKHLTKQELETITGGYYYFDNTIYGKRGSIIDNNTSLYTTDINKDQFFKKFQSDPKKFNYVATKLIDVVIQKSTYKSVTAKYIHGTFIGPPDKDPSFVTVRYGDEEDLSIIFKSLLKSNSLPKEYYNGSATPEYKIEDGELEIKKEDDYKFSKFCDHTKLKIDLINVFTSWQSELESKIKNEELVAEQAKLNFEKAEKEKLNTIIGVSVAGSLLAIGAVSGAYIYCNKPAVYTKIPE